MNIAFSTTHDAHNVHSWSGVVYNTAQSLTAQRANLQFIDKLAIPFDYPLRVKRKLYDLAGKKYLLDRELFVVRDFARQIRSRADKSTDVFFSPGSTPMALLECTRPKVFYSDATFASLMGGYDAYTNLCAETVRNGSAIEQASLDSCAAAIYASDWAARSAIEHYRADPAKVHVVPFGANVFHDLTADDIRDAIRLRPRKVCKLLFVGVDWKRKGGDKALAVWKALNEGGLPTELHVLGIPELPVSPLPKGVVNHGFIGKTNPEGLTTIARLYLDTHFMILPTQAEAFGFVFAEANAYGVPNLAPAVGGVPTAVRDGIGGQLFDPDAPAKAYAAFIVSLFHNYDRYESLALSAFNEYKTRLNWGATGQRLMELIRSVA